METTTASAFLTLTLQLHTTVAPVPINHPYFVFARKIYVWLVPVMVTVLLISVIGNGLIVLSAPLMGRQMSSYHRLCVSLGAADAWAASLLIAGLIVNSYMPVVLKIHKKNDCMTAVLEIFRISGMLTSNLHILALALNQFVGIVYPIKYKTMITTRRLRMLILILWVVPIVFVGSWFFVNPNDGFRHPQCRQRFYNRLPFRMSVFVVFIVPLLGTFIFYGCIVRSLLIAKAKSANDVRRSVRSSYRKRVKSRMKLMYTTLLILLTFVLSWGLCVLYFLLVCVEGCALIYMKSVSFYAGFLLNSSVNFLVALKLLFNPLIYALRLDHIRSSVLAFLHVVLLSHLKQKGCGGEAASPKSERIVAKPVALTRTTSCHSSPTKCKRMSMLGRHYDERPRVLTNLVHLIENDCSMEQETITRAETPNRLIVNEFSFCSTSSSTD